MKKLMCILVIFIFIGNGFITKYNFKIEGKPIRDNAVKEEINYEQFKDIKIGDSYENIIKILGKGKKVPSAANVETTNEVYSWKGKKYSSGYVTFQNNIVIGKCQIGLKEYNSPITKEQYNEIYEGMTYDEVKCIIGEGQILSQTKYDNIDSVMYGYINNDRSNANFTFNNGKLILKTQFNLH